jgi:hypothetical protein
MDGSRSAAQLANVERCRWIVTGMNKARVTGLNAAPVQLQCTAIARHGVRRMAGPGGRSHPISRRDRPQPA